MLSPKLFKSKETNPVAFRLTGFNEISLPSEGVNSLNLSVKEFDLSNNTRGSSFEAPLNGIYHFDVRLNFSYPITDYASYLRFHLFLLKGSETIEKTTMMNAQTPLTPDHTISISTTVMLSKGDIVSTSFSTDANPGTGALRSTSVSFSGFKVADFQTSGQSESPIR
jgi:hypothetical protein